MNRTALPIALILAFGSITTASAATIFVDRGLPNSTNVNVAAGANRSNISWGNVDGFINGDSFVASSTWSIEQITFWIVGSNLNYSNFTGCNPMTKVTFTLTSPITLPNGTIYDVAINATPNNAATCVSGGDTSGCLYVHGSNAALSGTPQQGSNNLYINFDTFPGGLGMLAIDSNGNGWDKSSDINIQVSGTTLPEPSSILLIAAGLGTLAMIRRRN